MPKAIAILVLLTLSCLFLAGCRSVPAPPGFIAAGSAAGGRIEFPGEVTPDARYAMLCWYIDVQGEAARDYAPASLAVALNARFDLRTGFLSRAAAPLLEEFPHYMRLDRAGHLEVDAVALAGELECRQAIEVLARVRKLLNTTGRIAVPVDECKEFLRSSKGALAESSFLQWAVENPVLELPPGSAAGLEVKIDAAENALRQKKKILDAQAGARRLVADGKFYELLEMMDNFAASLPADLSLEIIGDDTTLTEFNNFKQDIAGFAIAGTLQTLQEEVPLAPSEADASRRLTAVEERFASAWMIWNANSRYLAQLDTATRQRCRDLINRMAEMRRAVWMAELEKLRSTGRSWELVCRSAALRSALSADGSVHFRCYQHSFNDAAAKLDAALAEVQKQAVTVGMGKYLAAGASAMDIGNHFGTVVVTDYMIRNLAAMTNLPAAEMPEEWRRMIERSAEMLLRAEKKMNESRGGIGIRDFTSVAPGLGATLADDLAFELDDLLKRLGITVFNGVHRLKEGQEDGAIALKLVDGRVAEYVVTDGNPVESQRLERFLNRGNGADGSASVQRLEEWTIRGTTRTRQAHIRFFFTFQTPASQRRIECNEFYSRSFLNESFDPAKDLRIIDSAVTGKVEAAVAPPALKHQRIWSDGEMLDFARKDALRLAALQLVDAFLEGQLASRDLAAEIAAEGRESQAVDMLGRAHFMLRALGLAEHGGRQIDFGTPLAAAAYPELTGKIRQRVRECVQTSEQLLQQAALVLDSTHVPTEKTTERIN